MIKTNSFLSENFLNVIQAAYTLRAELNRPPENRCQQSRACRPMVMYTASDIETQFWQRD